MTRVCVCVCVRERERERGRERARVKERVFHATGISVGSHFIKWACCYGGVELEPRLGTTFLVKANSHKMTSTGLERKQGQ